MMCMENLSQCNDRRLLCLLTKQLSKVGAACSLWLKGPRQHILLCVLMQPCFPSCTCNATSESRTTLQMQTTSSPACIPDSEAQHSGLLGKSSSHYAHLSTRFSGNTSNAIQGSMVGTATTNTDRLRKHEQVVQLLHVQWQCNVYSVCLPK